MYVCPTLRHSVHVRMRRFSTGHVLDERNATKGKVDLSLTYL